MGGLKVLVAQGQKIVFQEYNTRTLTCLLFNLLICYPVSLTFQTIFHYIIVICNTLKYLSTNVVSSSSFFIVLCVKRKTKRNIVLCCK